MNLFREGFSAQAFLLCVAAGALIAFCYDVFRVVRIVFHTGRRTVFVLDVCFCILAAVTVFLVALPVSFGQIRFFQLAGEGIGAAIYALAPGALTGKLAKWLRNLFEKVIGFVRNRWQSCWTWLSEKWKHLLSRRKKHAKKKISKSRKFP